jgi:hypothetical protein
VLVDEEVRHELARRLEHARIFGLRFRILRRRAARRDEGDEEDEEDEDESLHRDLAGGAKTWLRGHSAIARRRPTVMVLPSARKAGAGLDARSPKERSVVERKSDV